MELLKQKLNNLGSLRLRAIEPGLSRTLALMEKLGNPELKLGKIVHVAGTNGKGSTIAFLRAMLEAAGHSCNVYTSPDLIRFNERIVLRGKEISDEYLLKLIEQFQEQTKGIDATFFEATTAIAFMAFAENSADYTLLETGLGGRLDSTNIIKSPALTVITPVSFDHMDFLGNTIKSIASEKAGIIKQNIPCVVSRQPDEALEVLNSKCSEQSSKTSVYGQNWNYQITQSGFDLTYNSETFAFPNPSLAGKHQYLNAACAAIAALNLGISPEAISKGVTTAKWPARLQRITKGEIPEELGQNWQIWLDGAHNEDGAKTLAAFLSELPAKPTYILCAMLKTKNPNEFFPHLKPVCEKILTIPIENENNSLSAEALSEYCKNLGINASPHRNLSSAIKALADYDTTNARLVICGSLYLAGVILRNNE